MDEVLQLAAMEQAVGLDTFWPTVASHASPDTLLALAGTSHTARDAAVQCAPKATLALQLTPPPTPGMLAVLRNSGRTLPASIIINNNSVEHGSPVDANHTARLMLPQLSCAAVSSLQLGDGPWLVDTALLASICAALPALHTLRFTHITPSPHLRTAATHPPAWPALRAVSLSDSENADVHPARTAHLLAVLGVRAGGGNQAIHLVNSRLIIGPMLLGNQMHALRKLCLINLRLWKCWGADEVGGALIRNAPALEHLQLYGLGWMRHEEQGTSAMSVPWRILEVRTLDVDYWFGLPLGSTPGQPPLILRVTNSISVDGDGDGIGAEHLVSPAPGKRQVQLECTRAVYRTIKSYDDVRPILRALTLTTPGLSNLILDGIDSADDIKDLVDLSTTGLCITLYGTRPLTSDMLEGLRDLPQSTKLELGADHSEQWAEVDERLLASLPAHVTDVRLSGRPSLEVVSRMCVEVSRLPHRQAHPLRLCVPGVVGWFDAVAGALTAAGIDTSGVAFMPQNLL